MVKEQLRKRWGSFPLPTSVRELKPSLGEVILGENFVVESSPLEEIDLGDPNGIPVPNKFVLSREEWQSNQIKLILQFSGIGQQMGVIVAASRHILPGAVREVITNTLAKKRRGNPINPSKGREGNQRFIPQPTVLPETNVSAIANEPLYTLRNGISTIKNVVLDFGSIGDLFLPQNLVKATLAKVFCTHNSAPITILAG